MAGLGALCIDTSGHTPEQTSRLILAEFQRRQTLRKR
jgi:hypothetical protein